MLRRRHHRLPERYRDPEPERYEREGDPFAHPHRHGHCKHPDCRYCARLPRGGYREPRNYHHRKPRNDCSGERGGERLRIGEGRFERFGERVEHR